MGQLSTMVSVLASGPSSPGFDYQGLQLFSEVAMVNVSEVNQRHCFEESGQWLKNENRTHLVLVSGKQVLQKY